MGSHADGDGPIAPQHKLVKWGLRLWWALPAAIGISIGVVLFSTWEVALFFGWIGAVVGTVGATMIGGRTSLWSANKAGTSATGGAIFGVGIGALIGTISGVGFGVFWIVSFVVAVASTGFDSSFFGEFGTLGTVLLVVFLSFVMLPFVGALAGAASGAVAGVITGTALALWPRQRSPQQSR